jgi:hypothetical protein
MNEKQEKLFNDWLKSNNQTGLQRFISTDIKNVKPFAASKIGKSWDEI